MELAIMIFTALSMVVGTAFSVFATSQIFLLHFKQGESNDRLLVVYGMLNFYTLSGVCLSGLYWCLVHGANLMWSWTILSGLLGIGSLELAKRRNSIANTTRSVYNLKAIFRDWEKLG